MENYVVDGIMGMCVADALGVPVEFQSREQLNKNPVKDMRGYGTYNQPVGTWSDDTSMTLCLGDSITSGLDYLDIMNKFSQWLHEGKYCPYGEVFDIGNGTRKAILRYDSGIKPLHCGGENGSDNGNGSLMRILPLVYYLRKFFGAEFQSHKEAFDIIHNVSALTHAHIRSKIACGIYLSIASMLHEKVDLKNRIEEGIHKAVEYYKEQAIFSKELSYYNRLQEKEFGKLSRSEIKSSGYVVDTLEAAIWCLLNTNSYKECVLMAVNLGGDTDTVAAVAGGLAGIFYRYENIPPQWVTKIARREYIEEISKRLFCSLK